MHHTPRKRLAFAALAAVASATMALPASAGPTMNGWHWRTREVVLLDRTGIATFVEGIRYAADQWNSTGSHIHLTPRTDGNSNDCTPVNGAIVVCSYTDNTPKGGYTTVVLEDDQGTAVNAQPKEHIRQAGAAMCVSPAPTCYGTDTETVHRIMTHEVGHALGLAHNEVPGSVMSTQYYATSPNADDAATLRQLYAHTDGPVPPRCPILMLLGLCL